MRLYVPYYLAAGAVACLFLLIPPFQTSGQLSSGSGQHLQTWETLSTQFDQTLRAHEETLRELSERLRTSESNGGRLTNLLDKSLTQNADLKAYNTQIAQRMQERDEDLAAAYEANKRKDKAIIELVIVCVIALLAAAALIYTHIIRT